VALVSGCDGLDAIRAILSAAPARLKPGAWLLLEHGFDQGAAVRELLEINGFVQVFSARDLEGRERVSGAQRG
jgi:release factor glutamine methyltransferase